MKWIGNQIYSDDSIHSLYTDQMKEKYGILLMALSPDQYLTSCLPSKKEEYI